MIHKSDLCPVCQSKLQINRLSCPQCKAEYPVKEDLSPYDYLSDSQAEFLALFIKCRGNLKSVGEALQLSYPAVRGRLDLLLSALGYSEEETTIAEGIDMTNFGALDHQSVKASEIVRCKLYESGGVVEIQEFNNNKMCKIIASNDGTTFSSDKLGANKYDYKIFDVIVDLLLVSPGRRAPKGHGRGKIVGEGKCTPDTVVGTVQINYLGRKHGEKATTEPVFVLAAVLQWADIAKNGHGYMELTANYLQMLREAGRK